MNPAERAASPDEAAAHAEAMDLWARLAGLDFHYRITLEPVRAQPDAARRWRVTLSRREHPSESPIVAERARVLEALLDVVVQAEARAHTAPGPRPSTRPPSEEVKS